MTSHLVSFRKPDVLSLRMGREFGECLQYRLVDVVALREEFGHPALGEFCYIFMDNDRFLKK